jgi:hypothetical protein
MIEAYAAVPTDVFIYECLELTHIMFDAPVRVVANSSDDIFLGGLRYTALPVSVSLPGFNEDGPTQARISIDNCSSLLVGYLQAAIQSDQPISVTYRAFRSDETFIVGDEISGLELWDVDVGPITAEGSLRYRELELQAFPLATYDAQSFPALQGG